LSEAYTAPVMRTLLVLCCSLAISQVASTPQNARQDSAVYEAYAIRFGSIPFAVSGLVAGADRTRTIDIPVMVWLLKGSNGRQVLVDSGFYRQQFLDQWKPQNFRTPAVAVEAAGVKPDAVTDIIISHAHWDHVDGADLFPKATIWIQRDEYTYYTGEAWHAPRTHGGVFFDDMAALLKINTQGRLKFVDGDDQEVLPGIRAYIGGKHTHASQYVSVSIDGGTAVFASDNIYLYENLEKLAAIAQTVDGDAGVASNLKAQYRIRTLASDPHLIVPGHEPLVFEKFPSAGDGIVRIK